MNQNRIIPYEGKAPFIFISYAHKDSDRVLPVLAELDKRNYRIWYDDGIAPGSEWPENIAQHLNDSALIIAFISANSIDSANCRREVTFALAKKKPFLAILLEPTEMSLGMEMQLSAQQCIMKYKYQTEDRFMEKVCACPDIEPCLKEILIQQERPEKKLPPVEENAVCEETGMRPEPISNPAPGLDAVEKVPNGRPQKEKPAKQPKVKKEKTVRPAKVKKEKPVKQNSGKGAWKKVLLCLLGVCVAALAACIAVPMLSQIKITEDKVVDKNTESLRLYNETITLDTAKQISKLEKLQYIAFTECTFESGALAVQNLLPETLRSFEMVQCTVTDDLYVLEQTPNLQYLVLTDCNLTDAQLPALHMPDLRSLLLSGNNGITDLTIISECTKLQELDISNTSVTNLTAVAAMPLTEICFAGTKVSDVTPLGGITTLTQIDGSDSQVTGIDALAGLEKLSAMYFRNCQIGTIQESFACLRLRELDLSGNPLENTKAFDDCTILQKVNLSGTLIDDFKFLRKSSADLQVLNVNGCDTNYVRLEFLTECPELQELYIDGCYAPKLSFLTAASKLTKLSAVDCSISDISVLSNCTQLKWLRLAQNGIRDLTPLQNLNQETPLKVDLSFNYIEDYSPLKDLQFSLLSVAGNKTSIEKIQAAKCDYIVLSYSDKLLDDWVTQLGCYKYCIINCPADKQVKLEDSIGYKLVLVSTWQEVAAFLEQEGMNADYMMEME